VVTILFETNRMMKLNTSKVRGNYDKGYGGRPF